MCLPYDPHQPALIDLIFPVQQIACRYRLWNSRAVRTWKRHLSYIKNVAQVLPLHIHWYSRISCLELHIAEQGFPRHRMRSSVTRLPFHVASDPEEHHTSHQGLLQSGRLHSEASIQVLCVVRHKVHRKFSCQARFSKSDTRKYNRNPIIMLRLIIFSLYCIIWMLSGLLFISMLSQGVKGQCNFRRAGKCYVATIL